MASDPGVIIIQAVDPNCDIVDLAATRVRELTVADATNKDLLYTILLELRAMHMTLANGLNTERTEISDAS